MTTENESDRTIFKKGKYVNNFTTVPNEPFRNVTLSWKARGLLIYLLTLPDDWKINLTHLITQAPDGRDSLMGGIMELRKAGHIKTRENQRKQGRYTGVTYLVYAEPQAPDDILEPDNIAEVGNTVNGLTATGKTVYGKTVSGKSVSTKYLLNKRRIDDKILNDEIEEEEEERKENFSKNNKQEIAKVFKSYESEIGILTSLIGNEITACLEEGISPDWIISAIEEASRNNARNWNYVRAIIKRWQVDGFQSVNNKSEAKPKGKAQGKRIAGRKHNPNIPLEKRNDKRYAGMEFIGFDDEEGAE